MKIPYTKHVTKRYCHVYRRKLASDKSRKLKHLDHTARKNSVAKDIMLGAIIIIIIISTTIFIVLSS